MHFSFVPHPPNSAWLPPIDPNDEETLQHEQQMIQQQFKTILNQDIVGTLGPIDLREEEEQEVQQDQEQEEMDQYTDQLHIPGDQEI